MNLFLGNAEAIASGYLLLSVCYFLLSSFPSLLPLSFSFPFPFYLYQRPGKVPLTVIGFMVKDWFGFMVKDVVPPSGRADI